MDLPIPKSKQLSLFMTPAEIMEEYHPNPADHMNKPNGSKETVDELYERKLDESINNGLYDSVREHGVHIPISLNEHMMRIVGGHHRLAAMAHINPHQFVPVTYNWAPHHARLDEWTVMHDVPIDVRTDNFDKDLYDAKDYYKKMLVPKRFVK